MSRKKEPRFVLVEFLHDWGPYKKGDRKELRDWVADWWLEATARRPPVVKRVVERIDSEPIRRHHPSEPA